MFDSSLFSLSKRDKIVDFFSHNQRDTIIDFLALLMRYNCRPLHSWGGM